MVEIKNTKIYGLKEAIKRSGYPMKTEEPEVFGHWTSARDPFGREIDWENKVELTDDDYQRVKKLGKVSSGTGHDNFLKGIIVQFDLKYPLYFTKQLQRYHFIDFISSSSTMHTITKRGSIDNSVNKYVEQGIIDIVNQMIWSYNEIENEYDKYYYFMKIISNLPSGFELWAGMTTNYLQLKTIYHQRKNHKLKEDWGYFCNWVEELPFFKKLVLNEN